MEKTYKCKNGHRFKKEEAPKVTCTTCGEPAEPVSWNQVEGGFSRPKGLGVMEELSGVVSEIKGNKSR
jgi:hypothetical protein